MTTAVEIAEELAHLVEFECCTCEKGGSGDCSFEIEADGLSRAYMEAKYPHLSQREWPRKPVKAKPLDSAGLAGLLRDFKLERSERHALALPLRCRSLFKDEAGKRCDLNEGHDGMHTHHESYGWRG